MSSEKVRAHAKKTDTAHLSISKVYMFEELEKEGEH